MQAYNALEESWWKQEEYAKSASGKLVDWCGYVTKVTESGIVLRPEESLLLTNAATEGTIFVGFPSVMKPRLAEFRRNQLISVQGQIAFNSNYPPGYVIVKKAHIILSKDSSVL